MVTRLAKRTPCGDCTGLGWTHGDVNGFNFLVDDMTRHVWLFDLAKRSHTTREWSKTSSLDFKTY